MGVEGQDHTRYKDKAETWVFKAKTTHVTRTRRRLGCSRPRPHTLQGQGGDLGVQGQTKSRPTFFFPRGHSRTKVSFEDYKTDKLLCLVCEAIMFCLAIPKEEEEEDDKEEEEKEEEEKEGEYEEEEEMEEEEEKEEEEVVEEEEKEEDEEEEKEEVEEVEDEEEEKEEKEKEEEKTRRRRIRRSRRRRRRRRR